MYIVRKIVVGIALLLQRKDHGFGPKEHIHLMH